MKNSVICFFVMVLIFFFVTTVSAAPQPPAEKPVPVQVVDSIKDGVKDGYGEVKSAFSDLKPYLEDTAKYLGQTAEYLWGLQIKQGKIVGFTLLGRYAICYVAIASFWWWVIRRRDFLWAKDAYTCFNVIAGIVFVIVTGNLMYNLGLILTLLFNTDYWAIQQLILLLKASVQF